MQSKNASRTSFKPLVASLTVVRKEYITPHFIRIYLTADNVEIFANCTIGVNNKILIPPANVDVIHFPELDMEKNTLILPPIDVRPIVRTYTHRGIDIQKKELWIDFVAHGDEGPASLWAINAAPGSVLGVMMKSGRKPLYTKANNYLLVGDATAIPVLSAILEDLSPQERGICILEVHSKEDEQAFQTKADIEFIWLHNAHPQRRSDLAEVVRQQQLPQHDRSAYVAAEFESVKRIRHFLRKEKNWERHEVYAFAYWKAGQSEDQSQSERHEHRESTVPD